MKARLTFALLSIAIAALLCVCAWFTMQIFNTDVTEHDFQPAPVKAPEEAALIHEENIIAAADPKPFKKDRESAGPASADDREKAEISKVIQEPIPDYAGSIVQVAGNAYRVKESGARFKLSAKDKIYKNDYIQTGSDSLLTIVFADNTQLSLGEKTSCRIDEYVFDKSARTDSGFGLRLMEGACRIVTGFITTLNPDRFKVRTRMATISIRGCELALKAKQEEEKVFVTGLSSEETVAVTSAKDGAPVRNILTGVKNENIEESSAVISDPGTLVIISRGIGRTVRAITPSELREITTDTAPLNSVKHTSKVKPRSTVFVMSPANRNSGDESQ